MFNTADGGKSADFPFKPGHYVAACSSGRWCQGAAACLPALVWLVPWQARLQTHLSHGVHVGLVSWSVAWVLHRCHGCQGECGGGGVSVYQPSLTSVHLSNHLVLFIITSGERENPDRKPCKDARRVSGSDGCAWVSVAAPPQLYVQPGSCLSMLEFPGDWFMPFLFLRWRGSSSEPVSRASLNLDGEAAAADCCQGFSAGSWTADCIFLASVDGIVLHNSAACPPRPAWLNNTSFVNKLFILHFLSLFFML